MVSTLNQVDWSTTSYPNVTDEKVEICLVYSGRNDCKPIRANSSGSTQFSTPFRYASFVVIRHKLESTERNHNPVGQDTVTFKLSY